MQNLLCNGFAALQSAPTFIWLGGRCGLPSSDWLGERFKMVTLCEAQKLNSTYFFASTVSSLGKPCQATFPCGCWGLHRCSERSRRAAPSHPRYRLSPVANESARPEGQQWSALTASDSCGHANPNMCHRGRQIQRKIWSRTSGVTLWCGFLASKFKFDLELWQDPLLLRKARRPRISGTTKVQLMDVLNPGTLSKSQRRKQRRKQEKQDEKQKARKGQRK